MNLKRQREATFTFLKIDMRHEDPLSRAPRLTAVTGSPISNKPEERLRKICLENELLPIMSLTL